MCRALSAAGSVIPPAWGKINIIFIKKAAACKGYHQLTRAHTPDNVRRSLHRSASALRQKLHYAISFFLFHANPLRWALHGVCKVLFVLFALTGVSPSASQKPKITQKSITVRCAAVLPEQKSVQAMKSPQAILCVLARALKQHGHFSARQNRVCPCQLMVLLSILTKFSRRLWTGSTFGRF